MSNHRSGRWREREKLRRLYRRWSRADPPHRASLCQLPPKQSALRISGVFGVAASVLLIPFSQAIYPLALAGMPAAMTLFPFRLRSWVLLAVLALINAWVLDRLLARLTPQPTAVRTWLRALRAAACSVPMLNRYATPAWRRILQRRPPWFVREAAGDALCDVHRTPGGLVRCSARRIFSTVHHAADRLNRRLASDQGLRLLALGSAAALAFLFFDTVSATPTPVQRIAVTVLAIPFHLLAFADIFVHQLEEGRRQGAAGLGLLPYGVVATLWLIPVPYLALAGLLPLILPTLFLGTASARERTLVDCAFERRAAAPTVASGRTLKELLQQRWSDAPAWERRRQPASSLPPAAKPSWEEERLGWLYRVKSILVAFDAMALAWLALRLSPAAWRPGITALLTTVAHVAAVLGLGAVLVMAVYFVRLALRHRGPFATLDRWPSVQYLAGSQFSLTSGLLLGPALFHRDSETVAVVLSGVGVAGGVIALLVFVLRVLLPGGEPLEKPHLGVFALLGFVAIGGVGQTMMRGSGYAESWMGILQGLAFSSPAWGLVLYRALLPWLLRPFTVGHVLAADQPPRQRWMLRFLTLGVSLPLGGVMTPIWIYWRSRRTSCNPAEVPEARSLDPRSRTDHGT